LHPTNQDGSLKPPPITTERPAVKPTLASELRSLAAWRQFVGEEKYQRARAELISKYQEAPGDG
jgi:hypothetical protein